MDRIDISRLSVLQKIGQVIMPRLDFREPDSLNLAKRLVREFQVGGFIVFGGDRRSVKEATGELQSISETPLLFGCDAERGVGQILSDMTIFPFTMSLAAAGDEELVYREAAYIASEMKECGLNLIFAPVLDINSNAKNPIINIRSFGDDPELVSRLGTAFIRGCQDSGIAACGKHFPGHGRADMDSHAEMPLLDLTTENLTNFDLIPFRAAIESKVASIMTAHIALPKIERGAIPATISDVIIQGILRKQMGYGGVVITDSLHMSGINKLGDEIDLSHLALKAGCDIILDPRDPYALLSRINDMAYTGELSEGLLNDSAGRIISLKNSWLISSQGENAPAAGKANTLIGQIAERSVCLVKGGKLGSEKAVVCLFDVTRSCSDISRAFTVRLAESGIDFSTVPVTLTSPMESVRENSEFGGAIICLIYTTVGAWKKQFQLPEFFSFVLSEIASFNAETVLISFGSPYVIQGMGGFDTVMCAFDSLNPCQSAAADVLLGNSEAGGKLPVRIGLY
ncbi:MAG: glycoside hydrolase family 3 protein [Deltaproteobacteria bacterium]